MCPCWARTFDVWVCLLKLFESKVVSSFWLEKITLAKISLFNIYKLELFVRFRSPRPNVLERGGNDRIFGPSTGNQFWNNILILENDVQRDIFRGTSRLWTLSSALTARRTSVHSRYAASFSSCIFSIEKIACENLLCSFLSGNLVFIWPRVDDDWP